MNGYGERCGNANLASVVANLEFKMGFTTIGREKLADLTDVARFVAEVANLPVRGDQPYVGKSAFAHKAGVHVSAVLKDPKTYEHVSPKSVGNCQRVLVSDLSGRGNILYTICENKLKGLDDRARRDVLGRVKRLEHEGYELESADGEFELLVHEALRPGVALFEGPTYQVTSVQGRSSASVTVKTAQGIHSAVTEANSPLRALDSALRRCLSHLDPVIAEVRLTSCKYRVLDLQTSTGARTRVLVEWASQDRTWATMGVADNTIDAEWLALVHSLRLELMRFSAGDQTASAVA
jgi:2-isopropylmalate synthase